jgi:hypothetical protein
MELLGMAIRNQLFHRRKALPVLLLAGALMFLPAATALLVGQIRELADRPLRSLGTELILQSESEGKSPEGVKTRGVIQPFHLDSFQKDSAARLGSIEGVSGYSTALVLWQFDLKNNLTIVALDLDEPGVGLRKTEEFLMPGGTFPSGNSAPEAVVERHFAKLMGYKKGGEIMIGGSSLRIVGIVDFREQSNLSNAQVLVPYRTGLLLAGLKEPVVNQAFISLGSSKDIKAVTREVEAQFPGFSVITKDSLLKNLSGFNRMVYLSGRYLLMLVVPLSLLLLYWTLKLHGMEFRQQRAILRTLGWPRRLTNQWILLDAGLVLVGGLVVALALLVVLQWQVLPRLEVSPLLDQGVKL